METVNPSSTGRDLLGDLDEIVVLNYASQGQRLGNYIIDGMLSFAFVFLVSLGLAMMFIMGGRTSQETTVGVFFYTFGYSAFVAYYTLMEAFNKGRTIGKLITRTYAVSNDGQPLTLKQAFLRSLCRLVPFEVFSGFGSAPWHDKWTNTTVVKK